jgi:DNA cross-link repair 1C protein
MSTFCGEISEIPGIGVDNFSNTSLKCYFVSHCHSDHVRGIGDLQNSDKPVIYTTELSALILRRQYPDLNIKQLEIGFAMPMEIVNDANESVKFVVTALSGGHCMGSCMLLFQIEGLDILYTGDFRISLENARNVKALNEIRRYGKLVLYLDTTFMKEEYQNFPRQGESCKKITQVIQTHLKASSNNKGSIMHILN